MPLYKEYDEYEEVKPISDFPRDVPKKPENMKMLS